MSVAPFSIIITQKANADETDIYQYITEKFGSIYADKFRKKLINLFRLISLQPLIGRPAKQDATIRVFLMSRHNKIIYKLTDSKIIILRILNTKTRSAENF